MKRKLSNNEIYSYLNDPNTKFDADTLFDWFSDLSKEHKLEIECKEIWNSTVKKSSENFNINFSPILDHIHLRIRMDEYDQKKPENRFKPVIRIISRIAAILFIPLLILTTILWENGFISKEDKIAKSEIFVPKGTRTVFSLPDGTKGWLNSGSSLEFPMKFSGKYRTVNLDGEGYFKVKTNREKPFRVITDDLEVIAHGTEFNVMSYDDFAKTQIILSQGNLEVRKKGSGRSKSLSYLEPDNMFTYYNSSDNFLIQKVKPYKYTSWREGKLVFRNDPIDIVVKKLNNWYNVEITIEDHKIKNYSYRATFVDETIEEVLKLLKLSAPINYKILGREISSDGTIGKQRIILYYQP